MKYYALFACLLFALSAPSCQTSSFVVRRVASTEYRFANDGITKDSAQKYADDHAVKLPPQVSPTVTFPNAPLIYSFSEGTGTAKKEVRYKTDSSEPHKLVYYEIINPVAGTDDANRQLLNGVYEKLANSNLGVIIGIQGPMPDIYTNQPDKTHPFRAIVDAKVPFPISIEGLKNLNNKAAGSKTKKIIENVNGDFGLIINPPYPP
ncbi:hypothetical protein ACFP2F_02370 [Hymenobacter artigasi]|uniref:Lipoprotein n=1 Tax=Hymenobacter artigasi TaxID=2719616 RepID=A0ABX1HCJ8_9BACT|nr:hypothetical protein [Hymenobacter artigasi]NKI87897.1 hypothetical protein [Hymenobacter artigasi]